MSDYMKKILLTIPIATLSAILILSIISVAQYDIQNNTHDIQNNTQNNILNANSINDVPNIILKTKFLYYDKYWNGNRILINITIDKLGNLVYLEEYYKIDQDGNPEIVTTGRYYEGIIKNGYLSFEIVRPKKGNEFSLIKGVVVLDRERIFETWINSSATYKSYNMTKNKNPIIVKRVKPDIEKRTLLLGSDSYLTEPILTETRENIINNKYSLIAIFAIFIIYLYKLR